MTTPKHIAIIGAGLLLQPAGLAVLEHLGILDSALNLAAKVTGLQGQLVSGQRIVNSHYRQANADFYALGMHRASLCHVLSNRLNDYADWVQWHMSSSIQSCEDLGQQVRIRGQHQTQVSDASFDACFDASFDACFDAVLICNGAKSQLRPSRWIKLDRPYPWGAAWRIIPECVYDNPEILHQFYHKSQTMLGILPTGQMPTSQSERLSSIFWSLPQSSLMDMAKQQPPFGQVESQILHQVQQLWPKLQPRLAQSLAHADPTTPWLSAHYRDVVLRQFGQGRIGILGDAAHAMSPQLGQGANMALLDAWAFGQCLDQVFFNSKQDRNRQDWAAFWQRYHQHHQASTQFYQLFSRLLTPMYQSSLRWSGPVRDLSFQWMNQIPYFKTQMALTISGLKTNVFHHMDVEQIRTRR